MTKETFGISPKPIKGETNRSLVNFLAKHFGVSKNQVIIVAGKTFKDKIVDILK